MSITSIFLTFLFLLPLVFASVTIPPDAYCGQTAISRTISYTNYNIKHVSIIIRHGDRAPASSCWKNSPEWDCKDFGHSYVYTDETKLTNRLFSVNYESNVNPGTCERGQLTKQGYQQLAQNGDLLRDQYILQQNFLPIHFLPQFVYFRTTNYQRTRMSAQGLIEALYPVNISNPNIDNIRVISRDNDLENMFMNPKFCPKLSEIEAQVKGSEEVVKFLELVNAPLQESLSKIFGWDINKDIIEIFDCFQTHACHGMNFPDGMTTDLFDQVKANFIWLTTAVTSAKVQNFTYAQISIASFVRDLTKLIDAAHTTSSSIKFALYSGHDSTILPFLISYNIWDHQWPRYASLLQFELLTETSSGADFVRILYDNKEMMLPECNYVSPCPYDKFKSITMDIIGAADLC